MVTISQSFCKMQKTAVSPFKNNLGKKEKKIRQKKITACVLRSKSLEINHQNIFLQSLNYIFNFNSTVIVE